MCGLFGWNFKKKSRLSIAKREGLASVLAIANSLRGDKSWGVYGVSKENANGFMKKEADDVLNAAGFGFFGRLPLIMGHTRSPTMGKVCEKNAHPFRVGKIILAHNGTLYNTTELDKKYGRNVDVDSQHIAMHLSEGKDLTDIEGYGVITWNNTDTPNRVYLCRLKQGSICVFGVKNDRKDEVGIVWSSDREHLRSALGAARLDYVAYKDLDEGRVYYVEGGQFFNSDAKLAIKTYSNSYGSYSGTYDGGMSHWSNRAGRWQANHTQERRGYWVTRDGGKTYVWVSWTTPALVGREDDETRFPYGANANGNGYYGE